MASSIYEAVYLTHDFPAPNNATATASNDPADIAKKDLQKLSISLMTDANPTTSSGLSDLYPELVLNIMDHLEPTDNVCLALSNRRLYSVVTTTTGKPLKELFQTQATGYFLSLRYIFSASCRRRHRYCLQDETNGFCHPPFRLLHRFVYNYWELMERLEKDLDLKEEWRLCTFCMRFVRRCRCEACKEYIMKENEMLNLKK